MLIDELYDGKGVGHAHQHNQVEVLLVLPPHVPLEDAPVGDHQREVGYRGVWARPHFAGGRLVEHHPVLGPLRGPGR